MHFLDNSYVYHNKYDNPFLFHIYHHFYYIQLDIEFELQLF